MRTRKIPSMFRTPGRLLRWNRRYSASQGKPMHVEVSISSCAQAVGEIRKLARRGNLNARHLVVRDASLIPAGAQS